MNELELGLTAVAQMLARTGVEIDDRDRELLLSHATHLHGEPEAAQERVVDLFRRATRGFLLSAADGIAFVPTEAFAADLADSLEKNYPGAGAQFLRLATAYWTLRMLEGRVRLRHAGVVLQQLLESVSATVERVFFVDPEDDSMDRRAREALQRRTLRESGAGFDIEEFLIGNPLLFGNPLAE